MTARRRSLLYLEKLRVLHAVLTAFITAGLLAWGVIMWQHGLATPGDMVLICSLGFTILHGTRDLAVALVDLTQHVARLDEALGSLLVRARPAGRAGRGGAASRGRAGWRSTACASAIRAAPPILKGLDLVIEPGQRVGLVGASGAGKSTVLALLQRFYDIQGGHGAGGRAGHRQHHPGQPAPHDRGGAAGHLPVPSLGAWRTSATPGRTPREADVLAAATVARCRDFIEALPEGFETMVGDRGVKLSGGQRQRLAIARALLKNAPILLLDEATSALDMESEQAIQKALDNLMEGRTVIAIAHRLSTLRNFDRIVVMDAGRVVDDGPPDVLANRAGPYRDLLRNQQTQMIEELQKVA